MSTTLKCPRCGKLTTWENNEFRPFCSERCKMIDLGAWASEEYKLPTQDAPQLNLLKKTEPFKISYLSIS
jgi:Uncharacterized protein conserved in bacteria